MRLTPEREKEIREAEAKSTRVVAWYPHSQYEGDHIGKASVRGPFGRWFLVKGGDNGMGDPVNHPTPVADLFDDAKYAAIAMNSIPLLLSELDAVRADRDESIRILKMEYANLRAEYGSIRKEFQTVRAERDEMKKAACLATCYPPTMGQCDLIAERDRLRAALENCAVILIEATPIASGAMFIPGSNAAKLLDAVDAAHIILNRALSHDSEEK
jgi:hypothetical protein